MNRTEIIELNANLALLGRTRQSMPFLYSARGADGLPLLLTDPEEIPALTLLKVVRTAADKRLLQGRAYRQPDGLIVFELPHGIAQEDATRFVNDLISGLAGQADDLRRAVIQIGEES